MFEQKLAGFKTTKTTKGKASCRQDPIAAMEQDIVEAGSSTVEAAVSKTSISKLLENQCELLHYMKRIILKVDRLEDQMEKLEDNLVENFDTTNEKAFLE
ncbi:7581_t:CDS:2, partial [Gigaspora rosea]